MLNFIIIPLTLNSLYVRLIELLQLAIRIDLNHVIKRALTH